MTREPCRRSSSIFWEMATEEAVARIPLSLETACTDIMLKRPETIGM